MFSARARSHDIYDVARQTALVFAWIVTWGISWYIMVYHGISWYIMVYPNTCQLVLGFSATNTNHNSLRCGNINAYDGPGIVIRDHRKMRGSCDERIITISTCQIILI